MIRISFVALALLAFIFPLTAHAQTPDVTGHWLTENKRAVIELQPCEQNICGHVYWIIDGGLQFDKFNLDDALKKRPICDLKVLWGFEQDGDGRWTNGDIYKADNGETYSGNMELMDNGQLRVRGYKGISLLGKTQVWSRVNPADYKECNIPG